MTGSEVAQLLLEKYPKAEVLLKAGDNWVAVTGVQPTGVHRNAVALIAEENRVISETGRAS